MGKQLSLLNDPIYWYAFMISPEEEIKRLIESFKISINQKIKLSKKNIKSIAHISLTEFPSYENIDDLIIRKLNSININKSIDLTIDGFELFHHGKVSRTLYLKLKDINPVIEIYNSLIKAFGIKYKEIFPHLTIARSIPINDFNKISNDLHEFEYKGKFSSKLIVLRKVIDENTNGSYTKIY